MLPLAAAAITLALVFYSVAVWWEHATRELRGRHLLLFWLGLIFDTTGTTLMSRIAGSSFQLNLHGITGILAIALMLFHALWATIVHAGKNETRKRTFHKLSVVVWAVWLVPYLSGLIVGMGIVR